VTSELLADATFSLLVTLKLSGCSCLKRHDFTGFVAITTTVSTMRAHILVIVYKILCNGFMYLLKN